MAAPTNERCPICNRPVGNGPVVTEAPVAHAERKIRLCPDSLGCRRTALQQIRVYERKMETLEQKGHDLEHRMTIMEGYIPPDTKEQFRSMWGSVSTDT